MNAKLFAAFACGAALALGACSGSTPPASTATPGPTEPGTDPADPGTGAPVPDTQTQAEKFDADLTKAQAALETARMGVTSAVALANAAETAAERTAATKALSDARKGLADAVAAMKALTPPSGDANRRGRTIAAATAADAALAADTPKLTAGEARLSNTFGWFRRDLLRYVFPNGAVQVPGEATNTAKIIRTPRTKADENGDQIANDDEAVIRSDTFEDILYEDGKKVFSITDDAEGGDEFKVDGYVSANVASFGAKPYIRTGLKLTNEGIVIRTGGTSPTADIFDADYTDMRRDITKWANFSVSQVAQRDREFATQSNPTYSHLPGQNGWDLVITFDEPRTRSFANQYTSWAGNGDFYWKSLVLPDPSQLNTDGEYYNSRAFLQPEGYRDLGTYEIWLSNHVGTDTMLEPLAGTVATCRDGSRGSSCPDDDVGRYLQYAAYGLFLYTADTRTYRQSASTWWEGWNGHVGRINTLHFGYLAFADEDGKRITDIGEAITGGIFKGYTLVHEVRHDQNVGENVTDPVVSKLLRGDVTLTVNIPKGSGSATLEGTMNNFQYWYDKDNHWKAYDVDNFEVALRSTTINADGKFTGSIATTPSAGFRNSGTGEFKGNFYGPRADKNDLEIAGSFSNLALSNGGNENRDRGLFGSFGAKQVPPTSN